MARSTKVITHQASRNWKQGISRTCIPSASREMRSNLSQQESSRLCIPSTIYGTVDEWPDIQPLCHPSTPLLDGHTQTLERLHPSHSYHRPKPSSHVQLPQRSLAIPSYSPRRNLMASSSPSTASTYSTIMPPLPYRSVYIDGDEILTSTHPAHLSDQEQTNRASIPSRSRRTSHRPRHHDMINRTLTLCQPRQQASHTCVCACVCVCVCVHDLMRV
jgi:hypothetical protein